MWCKTKSRSPDCHYWTLIAQIFFASILGLLSSSCNVGDNGNSVSSKSQTTLRYIIAPNEDAHFRAMNLSSNGSTVYVADVANNQLIQINEKTLKVEQKIALPGEPTAIANSDQYLYVIYDAGNKILKINTENTNIVNQITFENEIATTLAVGAENKLYVGLGEDSNTPNIKVYDISATNLIEIQRLPLPMSKSDYHSRIVGISHNRQTLFTAEGNNRQLDPFVTQWDISSNTPVAIVTKKLFGYDLLDPGKIVFSADDKYLYVLSDGTVSSQNIHKIYFLEDSSTALIEISTYKTDYLPIALAFRYPSVLPMEPDRMVIARDSLPARWSPSSKRDLSVNEFYFMDLRNGNLKETIFSVKTGNESISRNQLVISKNNTVFMLLGKEKSIGIAAVRDVNTKTN